MKDKFDVERENSMSDFCNNQNKNSDADRIKILEERNKKMLKMLMSAIATNERSLNYVPASLASLIESQNEVMDDIIQEIRHEPK